MQPLKRLQRPTNVSIVTSQDYVSEVERRKGASNITWGEPFWNLFHVLAEKVKDDAFPKIRMELLNLVYTICSNLPCPECKKHAVSYLNAVNYSAILTKQDLKTLLFNFHNQVNVRKNYPVFPEHLLQEKYEQANTLQVVNTFMNEFKKKYKGSFRLLADDMQRQKVSETLIRWFESNMINFHR